jgi:hypothetical protein
MNYLVVDRSRGDLCRKLTSEDAICFKVRPRGAKLQFTTDLLGQNEASALK